MDPNAMRPATDRPNSLESVRVLDVSQVLAGPYCAMLLGDLGCDIVKIEPVAGGDSSRHSLGRKAKWGESPAFLAVNRNKRSVALNLASERGLEAFKRLASSADVVIENYRPGTVQRLGIDYASLKKANPRLIYASISGYGQTGPLSQKGGYDIISQGVTGIMSVTGVDGEPPCKAGVPVTDIGAGMLLCIAILGALFVRNVTGIGQHVDTSLFEAGLSFGVWEATELWYSGGEVPGPLGSAHRMAAPYQALRTADGYMTVGAASDRLWASLAGVFGHPEWAMDPRFVTGEGRLQNRAELVQLIERETKTRATDHWLSELDRVGVPAGPVNNYRQALDQAQSHAREMVVSADYPVAGRIQMLGTPFKMSGTPVGIRLAPPTLGQHTDALLLEAGFTEGEIGDMRSQGIVA